MWAKNMSRFTRVYIKELFNMIYIVIATLLFFFFYLARAKTVALNTYNIHILCEKCITIIIKYL